MAPLRAALVGFGFIAEKGHLPAYLDSLRSDGRFELVAIADGCDERRAIARRLVPAARIYADHRALLASERDLDFVDIATPPCDHAAIADAALERGLHVLCEKPLTISASSARYIVDKAKRLSRVVFPCHNYKHAPVVKAVRRTLDQGIIGAVQIVSLNTFRITHARGVAEWVPDWRRDRAIAGGGIAMDHGSHTFYLAFDWMGAYPIAISATTATLDDHDTEDNLSCAIRFPGRRLATANLSWTAGMRRALYTIHGRNGAIRVEDDEIEIVTHEPAKDGTTAWKKQALDVPSGWVDASHRAWFRPVLDGFARALAEPSLGILEAEDAVRCIELIGAAYESARDGSREVLLAGGDRMIDAAGSPSSAWHPEVA